ncbi:MAG: peptide chain release factor N(5)-glutamine methyltransferase [Rhizobiaceae bacterium]|nr:peptide chain release factor N(5)-glutamine methyltransferase [Rhizobiaceae bacterium]
MADIGAMRLVELLRMGKRRLMACGLDDPGLESRMLIEHLTCTDRLTAISEPDRTVPADRVARVIAAFDRRAAGEPVHRILGSREFHGLKLRLSPGTLEPRPDTETLVDAMLPFVSQHVAATGQCRILDLGTGSGAIALALLAAADGAVATGADLSEDALSTARRNAGDNGLSARFETCRSDWFEAIAGRYDAIVSNPPYIRSGEIAGLDVEVRGHDPLLALDGGRDGLDAYRAIARDCRRHLQAGGRIGVEIGHDQKSEVIGIFEAEGLLLVSDHQDLGGRDRALIFGESYAIST